MADGLSTHIVIVETVEHGLDVDDSASSGEERMQRAHLFATGWFDDEMTQRQGILIADNIAHKFPIGTVPHDMMLRCHATGNEREGLIITDVNLGPKTPLTWSWSGTPPDGGAKVGKHKMPADGNKIIEAVNCTVGGAGASCTVDVILHSASTSTVATVAVTDTGVHSADGLFIAFSHDDYLTVDISSAVGDTADNELSLSVKVLCRERTGI